MIPKDSEWDIIQSFINALGRQWWDNLCDDAQSRIIMSLRDIMQPDESAQTSIQPFKPKMLSKDEFIDLAMDNGIGGESAGKCYDLLEQHFQTPNKNFDTAKTERT